MTGSFDPCAFDSYYFGHFSREDSEAMLKLFDVGTFLVRCSTSKPGYSLSVREKMEGAHQIHHYLIESIEDEKGQQRLQMHERTYLDVPSIISYYKMRKLEFTNLRQPAPKDPIKKVIANHKFDGESITDLAFERYEELDILRMPEEGWWVARNALGIIGLIPSNYVKDKADGKEDSSRQSSRASTLSDRRSVDNTKNLPVPAIVKVIADRRPSLYDREALTLTKGQYIHLTKMHPDGTCEGIQKDTGLQGTFPITYVEWTQTEPSQLK